MDLENLQPWQQNLLDNMTKYKGRGTIQITGRQTGKSQMSAYMRLWNDIHQFGPVEDLKLSEGTVYGSRYHCVEPVGGSWIEMQEWCFAQFGDSGKHIWGEPKSPEPQQRWYMNNRKFWFRNESDRLMFILKWS
jgi:hypothetical protein